MLDAHTHLEQNDYSDDRDELITKYTEELDGVITCCAHPDHVKITQDIVKQYEGFVFATFSIHPEYVMDVSEKEIDELIETIKVNHEHIVGIGETGLDYYWVKEKKDREKQIMLFQQFIHLAYDMNKPLIVHSRDAHEDTLRILEMENAKNVYWHMFGARNLLNRVIDNGYYIGVNAIVLSSKNYRKIVRDTPIDQILLETDAPWLSPASLLEKRKERNTSLTVKIVAQKISTIKKISIDEVDRITTENTIRFFRLRNKLKGIRNGY